MNSIYFHFICEYRWESMKKNNRLIDFFNQKSIKINLYKNFIINYFDF